MQIGFGILLEHEPHNFIREFQLKFHHELSILPGRQNHHITFKSPFKVHDIEAYVDNWQGKPNPLKSNSMVLVILVKRFCF